MSGTALVTGAASGIGKATALALQKAGYTVYGTSRHPETAGADYPGIRFLKLDLTDGDSIGRLAQQLPEIDVLVNNAGSSLMGAVEDTPIPKMRELFELIVFGNMHLIQGVLPSMRKKGSGLIINVSSFAEVMPVPCSAVYAGAKAALHIISNGLRQEVKPFGIRVVTVAPTFIRTPIVQERLLSADSVYFQLVRSAGMVRDADIKSGSPPEAVAQKIISIIGKKHPASFYAAGRNAFFLTLSSRLLPERLRESFVRKHFQLI